MPQLLPVAGQLCSERGLICLVYLAMDNCVFPKHNDLARCGDHEGRH